MIQPTRKVLAVMFLEFLVCAGVAFVIYQGIVNSRRVTRVRNVAVLGKSTVVKSPTERLKFYFTPPKQKKEVDTPPWEDAQPAYYTYNADGLHDSKNYLLSHNKTKTYRVVVLGDSFTFGQFLNTADNWTEQLEAKLRSSQGICGKQDIEVLNLGVAGFDVEYLVERYLDVGVKYQPDLVLWFESGSGFSRMNEIIQPLIKVCEEKQKTITTDQQKVSFYSCWEEAQKEIEKSYSTEWVTNHIGEKLEALYEELGTTPLLFATFESEENTKALVGWQAGRPNVHLYTTVPQLDIKREILPDRHPNVLGHQKIADSLTQHLVSSGQTYCEE